MYSTYGTAHTVMFYKILNMRETCVKNQFPCQKCVACLLNPWDAMGMCLNKQKLMYKVLAPSIIISYALMDAFMCPWLVKC